MSLIAESPWARLGHIYKDRGHFVDGDRVADSEHNYYARYVPDSAGVDPSDRTTYSVSAEVALYPSKKGLNTGWRNKDAEIDQKWGQSGLSYSELAYSPVGDEELDYDITAGFTVGTGGTGGSVGIAVDGGKIRHDDKASNYPVDSRVCHNWDFPGVWACDKARCSEAVLGNVGRVDAEEVADGQYVTYCPTDTSVSFIYGDGVSDQTTETVSFDPTLKDLREYIS